MTDVEGEDRDKPLPDTEKPEGPTDLDKRSWKYVARKTVREFSDDQCTDQAAALTYYAVLAVFPAMLALLSLLSLVTDPDQIVKTIHDVMEPLVAPSTLKTFEPVVQGMANAQGAGVTLVIGIAAALWSASGYVGAFGRAMNTIYEIDEGRPFWKLRPLTLLVTLIAVLLSGLVLIMLVVSGPLAKSIGDAIGLGDAAQTTWNIAKWPILLFMVVVIVAILYYATPNVRQPKFRWISVGAVVAIAVWVLASIAFAFYVSNFSSYDKTYGSLAGVIVALLWLWITNLALLFGAELDSELERGRELQAGIPAEAELRLPARDTSKIQKAKEKEDKDLALGRKIREQADPEGEVAEQYANDSQNDVEKDRMDAPTGGVSADSPGRK